MFNQQPMQQVYPYYQQNMSAGPAGNFNQNINPYQPNYRPSTVNPQTNQQPIFYQQSQSLRGRIVNSVEEITPNEVSMDGSVTLFPTRDFEKIYAKAWNADGTISTIEYTPKSRISSSTNNHAEQNTSLDLSSIEERLDRIEEFLTSNYVKGGSDNE